MGAFEAAPIDTERLVLTPLRPADADAMVDVLGDVRLHEFIGGQPAGRADLRRRYERLAAGSGDPDQVWLNWIVRRGTDDQPVGTVQATVTRDGDRWSAAIAWVVGTRWQGQGFATEAARAMVAWLRERGADVITANIHRDHHASAAVAARAGLTATTEEVDGERVWRAEAK
ncbi:GNAT family N-acetyltransferase [Phytohabitans sp. LJ34]|uniref:GNAT family N-acetyltransferase n=1 Tax=Phytohabitans sp. LJ34 TaxID=3452217 RepID=UPI003F8C378D